MEYVGPIGGGTGTDQPTLVRPFDAGGENSPSRGGGVSGGSEAPRKPAVHIPKMTSEDDPETF